MQDHVAFAHELPQNFPHRRARNAVGLADLNFIDIGAWLKILRQDSAAQIVDASGLPGNRSCIHGWAVPIASALVITPIRWRQYVLCVICQGDNLSMRPTNWP